MVVQVPLQLIVNSWYLPSKKCRSCSLITKIVINFFNFFMKYTVNEFLSAIKSYQLIKKMPVMPIENLKMGMVSVEGVILPGNDLEAALSKQTTAWYEDKISDASGLILSYRKDNFFFIDDGKHQCLVSTIGAVITCNNSKKWKISTLPPNLLPLKEEQNEAMLKIYSNLYNQCSTDSTSKTVKYINSSLLADKTSALEKNNKKVSPGRQGDFSCKEDLLTLNERIKIIGCYQKMSLDSVEELLQHENRREESIIKNRKSFDILAPGPSEKKCMLLALKAYLMTSEKKSIKLIAMTLQNEPYLISSLSEKSLKWHYLKKTGICVLSCLGLIYIVFFLLSIIWS